MRIKKMYQGAVPANLILNGYSTSQTDTYSCSYLNSQLSGYPVGSIYMSDRNTSPALLFGGTWEQLNGYYVYFGNGYNKTNYTGKNTQSHTLTLDQIPSHKHDDNIATAAWGWQNNISGFRVGDNIGGYPWGSETYKGGGQGHAHNIATIEVYAWRRTA